MDIASITMGHTMIRQSRVKKIEDNQHIVDALDICCATPIDFFNNGMEEAEYDYARQMLTINSLALNEVEKHFGSKAGNQNRRVLDIGSFLGVSTLALKSAGFTPVAQDITEFINHPRIQARYSEQDIEYVSCDLANFSLPYEDDSFDAVIMCEVLEHLNFNPIPVLIEINRILKKGGLFVQTTPNHLNVVKRIRLFRGKSVHDPIESFFLQLKADSGAIVGMHWREYTKDELYEMTERTGFECKESFYFHSQPNAQKNPIRKQCVKTLYRIFPNFLPKQANISIKREVPTLAVKFTETTKPKN